MEISTKSLLSEFKESCEREGQQIVRARENGWHQNMALWINYPRHIWADRDWNHKHRAYIGPHQVLCVYITVFGLECLWESWLWKWFWFICLLLGLFFPLFGFHIQLQYASSFHILFCHVFGCCLSEACSFQLRDREWIWRGGVEEELGGAEKGTVCSQYMLYEKRIYSQ